MRALPLNDVSWLGLVSMRAAGGVGQGELQKGAGSSSRVGTSPFPLGQAVGALPAWAGSASPAPAHRCFLLCRAISLCRRVFEDLKNPDKFFPP